MLLFAFIMSALVFKTAPFTVIFAWTFGTLFFLATRDKLPLGDFLSPTPLSIMIFSVALASSVVLDIAKPWRGSAQLHKFFRKPSS